MGPELINELAAFRRFDESGDIRTAFWAVSAPEIADFEARTGLELPPELRRFYEQIGHGQIQLGRSGDWSMASLNIIVDPQRLAGLFLHTDPSFDVDPELVENDDLPFFDTGSHCYLVMRPKSEKPDAIYWPYDSTPISQNIWDFADSLLSNPIFYHDTEEGAE